MKFGAEICKGVRCPECPFNKGEDGCLLAKRLDEIEITPEPCADAVPRTSVEYICQKNTVSTNPYEHKYHDKFMQFMDDPEISDFGRWQHSNGFNTALVAVKCDLDKVPSVTPKQPEPHWIPVTKDTPKEAGTYMCTCYDAGRRIVTLAKWQPRAKTWNLTGARAYWKVIAWCKRPEPYKGVTT